ncbi:MAG: hypothetical protein WAW07_15585 [Bacteroidales bacterium]
MSRKLAISMMVPAAAADIPKVSVQKIRIRKPIMSHTKCESVSPRPYPIFSFTDNFVVFVLIRP